jgi:hypothetical protein
MSRLLISQENEALQNSGFLSLLLTSNSDTLHTCIAHAEQSLLMLGVT